MNFAIEKQGRAGAILLALLVGLLVLGAFALPSAAQDGNLLQDPGFDGTYTNRGSADLNVPAPWGLWFTEAPRTEIWMNLRPVAFPHNGPGPNPLAGPHAFNMNKGYATFTAAIYQQVAVSSGANVTGSAWAQLKTCNIAPNADNCGSAVESGAYTRVGIDPNGGTNPYDTDIVWSANALPHDRWDQMTVSATATSGTVTLFLFTTQQWPAELNNVYWDNASLTLGGTGGVASVAGQPAGATAVPTSPPFVNFVSAQPPREDGSVVHTVQSGDTVDSIAFAYGVTRQEILDLNNLSNPRIIFVGQELIVRPAGSVETNAEATAESTSEATELPDATSNPGVNFAPSTPTPTRRAATNPFGSTIILADGSVARVVQEGDTFDSIALQNGLTREQLQTLNPEVNPRDVAPGDQLIIRPAPGSSSGASGASGVAVAMANTDVSSGEADYQSAFAAATQTHVAYAQVIREQLPPLPTAIEENATPIIEADEQGAALPTQIDELNRFLSDSTRLENAQTLIATSTMSATPLDPALAPTAAVLSVASGMVQPAINPAAATTTICVMLFEDVNHNRLQEVGEVLLGGGSIALLREGAAVASYTTTGAGEPYCFSDLTEGSYSAQGVAPEGYGLTTPAQFRVQSGAGAPITVVFGAAQGVVTVPTPEPRPLSTATAPTVAQSTSSPLQENAGLIAFGMAGVVLVVGGGIALAVRR